MQFRWWLIFNQTEFLATGLVSRVYPTVLSELGLKDVLVTKGNLVSVTVDGVMLSLGLKADNPFVFGAAEGGTNKAVYLDESTGDVYYGEAIDA